MHEYTISELAEKADVTKRTIHYYISKGLLPPASGQGIASRYDDMHYKKLLVIKKLKNQFMPLAEIKKIVNGLNHAQLDSIVNEEDIQIVGIGGFLERVPEYEVFYKETIIPGLEIHFSNGVLTSDEEMIKKLIAYANKLVGEK